MGEALSSIVRAGRLIRLLGWIYIVIAVVIGVAIILPNVVANESIEAALWAPFAAVVVIALLVLAIGAGVKQGKGWAKVLGAIICVLSLANFPLGTIIGAIALFYLIKGWDEAA